MVLSSTTKDIMEDGINNQEAFEDMNKEELINLVVSMKAEKDNTSEDERQEFVVCCYAHGRDCMCVCFP